MKKFLPISMLIFVSVLFTSCSVEDFAELKGDNVDEGLLTANITYNQLLGTWNLTKMETQEAVDLNGDKVLNKNLLDETDCFDPMSITFTEDMNFSSVNARMDFRAGDTDNKFKCMGTGSGPDTGTWEVEGDELSLIMVINGTTYLHKKEITLVGNSFSFEVTKLESQKYITNDPIGTAAENITVVKLEYTSPQ